jgi:transposase
MKKKPSKSSTTTTKKHFTVGIDLGDKSHAVCVLEDGSDEVVHSEMVENTKDAMSRSLGGFAKVGGLAVIEAGAQSAWIARHLSAMGFEVIVADARKLRVIATSYTKNDKNDAEILARLGRADRSIFSPVVHRGEQAQRDLAILKGRDVLVRHRAGLVNHVRGVMKGFGIKIRSCSCKTFPQACADALEDGDLVTVANVLETISHTSAEIEEIDRMINGMCGKRGGYPEAGRLQQIGGVGPLTALGFVLTVEKPSRLRHGPRSAGGYFGLVPKQRKSGDSDAQLRITKRGDAFVRRLLVNCAQYILGPFGPDTAMRRHGLRIAERGGKNAKKRAVVAVARKLAVTMASLWESGQDYVDFPGGKPPGTTTRKPETLGDCGATSA